MNGDDINALADSVFQSVKGYCAVEFGRMFERAIAPFKKQLGEIPAGKDGAPGSKGDAGEPGLKGERGADGAPGRDADQAAIKSMVLDDVLKALEKIPPPKDGAPGDRGEPGKPGDKGERGEKGMDGAAGDRGDPGDRGEPGVAGKDGAPGVRGDVGDRGASGERGEKGETGIAGEDGRPGERGIPGEVGLQGERGQDGAIGKDGSPGAAGQKGDPGERGPAGERGEKGEPGEPGANGEDGRDGRDGEKGADALSIDVLDGLDSTKGYRRATYAAWRGGMIRAFRATDPLGDEPQLEKSGWQVILNGVADEQERLLDDGRTVECVTTYTSGKSVTRVRKTAAVLYRQVWRDAKAYEPGDMVTFAGSVWHCNEPTSERPEVGGKLWTLAVKRGQAGSDGMSKLGMKE